MTKHGTKRKSKSERVIRRGLTFREFVRQQEEHKDIPVLAPSPVPLIDLVDVILAGIMLFVFITMLLLFIY